MDLPSESVSFNISSVPKLEGRNNYETWKRRVTPCLQASGLWKFIEGTNEAPEMDEESDYVFQNRLELYHAKAAQARSIIVSTCRPDVQRILGDVHTAKECWEKLSALCRDDISHVWRSFIRCSYEGEPIEQFCAKYCAALANCASAGIKIPDKIQAIHFLVILDGHCTVDLYEHWSANKRDQMRREPTNFPKFDNLVNELLNECRHAAEERARVRANLRISAPGATNVSRTSNLSEEFSQTSPPASAARKKLGETSEEQSLDVFSGQLSLTYMISIQAFSALQRQFGSEVWVASSRSNHHSCNNLDLFSHYGLEPSMIKTPEGSELSPGKGAINLSSSQSSDGQFRDFKLVDVRYNPSCSLNIISEGLLEKNLGVIWREELQKFISVSTGKEFGSVTKLHGEKVFTVQARRCRPLDQ